MTITGQTLKDHGISNQEYETIRAALGRKPNMLELAIYSVMWSEHCSYKSSKPSFKHLPFESPRVLVKAGEENAGVLDMGNGYSCVFKIESHNHPSAVEPFQGAATGVGGIIRDIFTMGAWPVAIMDSLRFGSLKEAKVKRLFSGVVSGIAHYGNCIGIPTVGGEVAFDPAYEGNPLVNAMCIGILENSKLQLGSASGIGNRVMYVGSATGKDGIHGATFASEEITEKSESRRPSVQVGDPFMEKLLLEACMELFETDYLVGIQDMGAAGLTCSTCETASRGGSGVEIDIAKVPQRESDMNPIEIMLSESQERMLLIVKQGCEEKVQKIFHKWDLHAVDIGVVTDTGRMVIKNHGEVVADIPALSLTDGFPPCNLETARPSYLDRLTAFDPSVLQTGEDLNDSLMALLSAPTIASKHWVYEQYDHMVQTNTLLPPGSDSAVVRVREAGTYLAITTDCNGRFCYLDPYTGGVAAVCEAARNITCTGGIPIGVTDCLNFASPTDPEVMWQFKEALKGIGDACRCFGVPVTGGNVSFYNESPNGHIFPTPIIGMVGLIEKKEHITRQWFAGDNDFIYLLGITEGHLGGSEYLKNIRGKHAELAHTPPPLDLEREKTVQETCSAVIHADLIRSAHDCSEGGLAVAAAECCFSQDTPRGAVIDISCADLTSQEYLFGEDHSRIIVSVPAQHQKQFEKIIKTRSCPSVQLGRTGGATLRIVYNGKTVIDKNINNMKQSWTSSIERFLTNGSN